MYHGSPTPTTPDPGILAVCHEGGLQPTTGLPRRSTASTVFVTEQETAP